MALTEPDIIPSHSLDENTFNSELSAFMSWAATIPSQFNTLTFGTISAASASSVSIGSGSKSFTLSTDVPFPVGAIVMCWNDKTAWTLGRVTAYNSGTKLLTITVIDKVGSGTLASWVITLHGLSALNSFVPSDRVRVKTGNGCGSTNIYIRRFGDIEINIGTAITYADSATDGATFTANEDGWYGIDFQDECTAEKLMGISLNSTELTTSILNITAATKLAIENMFITTSSVNWGSCQVLRYFSAGDVIRAHMETNTGLGTTNLTAFDIFKL